MARAVPEHALPICADQSVASSPPANKHWCDGFPAVAYTQRHEWRCTTLSQQHFANKHWCDGFPAVAYTQRHK